MVTCSLVGKGKKRKKHCSSQLISGTAKISARSARARLARAGSLYAVGLVHNGRLVLHARRPVRAGRYLLVLTSHAGRVWVATRQWIRLG